MDLGPYFFLNIDAVARRESLESRSQLLLTESDKTTLLPKFSLTYRRDSTRLGLSGRVSRTDQNRTGTNSQRDDYFDLNFWLNSEFERFRMDLSAQESASWRYTQGGDRNSKEHNLGGAALWNVTDRDEVSYRFSRVRQDAAQQDLQTTFTSNNLQYRGNHRFDDERGYLSLHAVASHFRQNDHRNDSFDKTYVQPVWGGYTLDDTPEFHDPLEEDPVAVAGQYDNDRDTATEINIGDNASVVREFGGDYRNVILDFGEPEEMISVVLYVDRTIRFPELIQWELYVSDDPEGRDWGTAISAADYELQYKEWETGRQGWTFDFHTAINHRRLKLVNLKLGPTEPELYLTEMEIYQTSVTSTPDITSTVLNRRLNGEVGYNLTTDLSVRYSTNLTARRFDDGNRNLRGVAQVAGANWRFSDWVLTGQYEAHTLRGESRRDTDANSQMVSMSRNRNRPVSGRLSYNRTVDNSYIAKHLTHSVSGDLAWRVAPLLVFTQRVSYGRRDDPLLEHKANSWSLISELRGTPRPNVSLEMRRADRWVDQEAGSGFTTFNDSDLTLSWSIMPLLQLTSQVVYQVRETDDWFYRNNLSWSPLPGGSVHLRLRVTDQQDTRADYSQRGGGVNLTWRPRPTLNLLANIDKSVVKQFGQRNTPLSYQFRGSWSF